MAEFEITANVVPEISNSEKRKVEDELNNLAGSGSVGLELEGGSSLGGGSGDLKKSQDNIVSSLDTLTFGALGFLGSTVDLLGDIRTILLAQGGFLSTLEEEFGAFKGALGTRFDFNDGSIGRRVGNSIRSGFEQINIDGILEKLFGPEIPDQPEATQGSREEWLKQQGLDDPPIDPTRDPFEGTGFRQARVQDYSGVEPSEGNSSLFDENDRGQMNLGDLSIEGMKKSIGFEKRQTRQLSDVKSLLRQVIVVSSAGGLGGLITKGGAVAGAKGLGALGLVGGTFGIEELLSRGVAGKEGEATAESRREGTGIDNEGPVAVMSTAFKRMLDPTGIGETLARKAVNYLERNAPDIFKPSNIVEGFKMGVGVLTDKFSNFKENVKGAFNQVNIKTDIVEGFTNGVTKLEESYNNFKSKITTTFNDAKTNFKEAFDFESPDWVKKLTSGIKNLTSIFDGDGFNFDFKLPDFNFEPELNIDITTEVSDLVDDLNDRIRRIVEKQIREFTTRFETQLG